MSKMMSSEANSLQSEMLDSKYNIENIEELSTRKGMNDMLGEIENRAIDKSIRGGLRNSLTSVVRSHQKIIQLFTIMNKDTGVWNKMYKDFCSSLEFESWKTGYSESLRIIDNTCRGMISTLCTFLTFNTNSEQIHQTLSSYKDQEPNPIDKVYLPWGNGSLVQSLIDSAFVFSDDRVLERSLKDAFTKEAKKIIEVKSINEMKFADQFSEIERYLSSDFRYELEAGLVKAEEEFRELGQWRVIKLGKGMKFIGTQTGTKPNGYGWLMQEDNILMKGEFEEGELVGLGEEYVEKTKYYLGEFRKSVPHGNGIIYRKDGSYKYVGQVMNGLRHGIGSEYLSDGTIGYKGTFFNDKKDGCGILIGSDGKVSYRGAFKQGKISQI